MTQKIMQKILDMVFIFSLFILSNVFALFHPFWLVPEFVFVETVFWFMLALLSLWLLGRMGLLRGFWGKFKASWALFPFLVFAAFSIFWSVYWEVSLSRWLMFLFTLIAAGYIGTRYTIREIIGFLSVFGVLVLIISAIFIFFIPSIGIMNYYIIHGAWRGIYWHKNHMGLIAAFVNILMLINLFMALPASKKWAWIWGVLYLFSLVFTYETDTVAAYLTIIGLHCLVLVAFFLMKFGKRIRRQHYIIFGAIAGLAMLLLFANLDFVFSIFNRNSSLTGRVPMWGYLFTVYLNQRPAIGYGFNAFWYVESHRVVMQMLAGYPDQIIISDNGFIDILINTGYIGLGLFIFFYVVAWWRSIQYSIKAVDIAGVFPVIFMAYTLIANISWSLIFENESFFMLIMLALLFAVPGKNLEHEAKSP